MAVTHKIGAFAVVELTEAVDDAPARIVFAPIAKLRVVDAAPRG